MNYGYVAAAMAYIIWGLLPVYWKWLAQLSSFYLLSARLVFSFFFCVVLIQLNRCWPQIKTELKQPKRMLCIGLAGVLITLHWGVYIWAVNSQHIVDASMGSYLNPLIVVLFSTLFFKEKLTRWECISMAVAAFGVLIMIVRFGEIPWIALTLGLSFALYGAVKKTLHLDGLVSLTLETTCMFPISLVAMYWLESNGQGAIPYGSSIIILTVLSGVVTAVPLLLYGTAVKNIPFSTVGFFQYISPTISLMLGILIYGEPFTGEDFLVFLFIWAALAIYLCSGLQHIWVGYQHKKVAVR